ncbi:hypothetical protein [Promicromonospora sukumoe]
MERITLPALAPLTLTLPSPAAQTLTLPTPEPIRLVLPASMIPQAPRLAAGSVEGSVSVSGSATEAARAIGRASGTVSGAVTVSAAAKARAVADGGIAAAATLSGMTGARLAGTITGSASITGKAVAKLSGAVTAAASIVGTAKARLTGGLAATGDVYIATTAAARATATGGIAAAASVAGTAIQALAAPSRVNKSGDQDIASSSVSETLTGWVLAAGYQGAATTNGLLVVGSGTVNITAQVKGSGGGNNKFLKIMRNGIQVGSEVQATTTNISASASSVAVSNGDVVSVMYRGVGTLSSQRKAFGGAETYIQITAV